LLVGQEATDAWWYLSEPVEEGVVEVAEGGQLLTAWNQDENPDADPECRWWNGTFQYKLQACGTFQVTRMSRAVSYTALERARACAVRYQTECVLSAEIGLDAPAAFVYDELNGMEMVLAPKILPPQPPMQIGKNVVVNVKLQIPGNDTQATGPVFRFNRTVTVEYLSGIARTIETRTFEGIDAFCIQSLRHSVDAGCWEQLD
jgi:hypothetical protein